MKIEIKMAILTDINFTVCLCCWEIILILVKFSLASGDKLCGFYRWFQKATVKCFTSNQLQRLAILICKISGILVNTLLILKTCQV